MLATSTSGLHPPSAIPAREHWPNRSRLLLRLRNFMSQQNTNLRSVSRRSLMGRLLRPHNKFHVKHPQTAFSSQQEAVNPRPNATIPFCLSSHTATATSSQQVSRETLLIPEAPSTGRFHPQAFSEFACFPLTSSLRGQAEPRIRGLTTFPPTTSHDSRASRTVGLMRVVTAGRNSRHTTPPSTPNCADLPDNLLRKIAATE